MYGVGILIKKKHKENIESFTGFSDRVALLNIKIEEAQISIIQVYAPPKKSSYEDINNFYITIRQAIYVAHKTYILMGDFNAKIGKPKQEENLIMKPNGYCERNAREQILINFAMENKLAIINTFFNKKLKNKWTWKSPGEKYRNEIDFVLSNIRGGLYLWKGSRKYINTYRSLNCNYI